MSSPSTVHRPATADPWVLFSLSLVSVAVHVLLAFGSAHGLWMTVFMLAMAAACLPCTASLLRSCNPRALITMMALSAVSMLVHGVLLVSGYVGLGASAPHEHHGGGAHGPGVSGVHGTELFVLVVIEAGVLILAVDQYKRRV